MNHKVALLGPEGTFSYAMGKKLFPDSEYILCQNFDRVFSMCQKEQCLGLVPIENSLFGSVDEVLDLLIGSKMSIWKTVDLPVHHALGAKNMKAVHTIASHPQALAQCRHYMSEHQATMYRLPTMSSVQAIELALQNEGIAAIGSAKTMEKLGLPIIDKDIQGKGNTTRFAIVAEKDPFPELERKQMSIQVMLREDTPGALFRALAPLKEHQCNMSRIVSRPTGAGIGNYVFVIDFAGNKKQPQVMAMLKELQALADIQILGEW